MRCNRILLNAARTGIAWWGVSRRHHQQSTTNSGIESHLVMALASPWTPQGRVKTPDSRTVSNRCLNVMHQLRSVCTAAAARGRAAAAAAGGIASAASRSRDATLAGLLEQLLQSVRNAAVAAATTSARLEFETGKRELLTSPAEESSPVARSTVATPVVQWLRCPPFPRAPVCRASSHGWRCASQSNAVYFLLRTDDSSVNNWWWCAFFAATTRKWKIWRRCCTNIIANFWNTPLYARLIHKPSLLSYKPRIRYLYRNELSNLSNWAVSMWPRFA